MTHLGIIGNGIAATTAVREIRSKDSEATIEVFTDERHGHYPRPYLIDLIAGRRSIEDTIRYGQDWYNEQDAVLHKSMPVIEIEPKTKRVLTTSTDHTGFDSLLLAVGSIPFVPPFDGLWKRNVYVIRTLDDALDIKEATKSSGREIVVGGGILGIELAAAMKEIGGDPIVVTNIETLLPIQLDAAGSHVLLDHLRRLGIAVVRGFSCVGMAGDSSVTGVVADTGDKIDGDLVVIATGVRSNTQLAKNSGIAVKRGIDVNDYMETSAPGIFAAGDCCEWRDQWFGIIPWATATARVAAHNMLESGSDEFEGITPSNTLQVAGIDLSSIGLINPKSPEYESITAIDDEKGTYFKVVTKNHVAVGGIALGDRKVAMKIRGLVSRGVDVSEMKESVFE
jgi:nitrite reductase (NADH) large subunit